MATREQKDQLAAFLAGCDPVDLQELSPIWEDAQRATTREAVWWQHATAGLGRLLLLAKQAEREYGGQPVETLGPVPRAGLEIAQRFQALLADFETFDPDGRRIGHRLVRGVVAAANDQKG